MSPLGSSICGRLITTRWGEDVSSFLYDHDLFDRVTHRRSVRGGINVNTRNYTYDQKSQLVSATKPFGTGNETFSYDLLGNRLKKGWRECKCYI